MSDQSDDLAEREPAPSARAGRPTAERPTAEPATAERATAERATAARATAERATAEPAAAGVTGAAAMFAADLASRSLGIEIVELSPGQATLRMTVTEQMINGHDIAHGGYVFLLADTAFACACNSEGSVTVAAGADITFIAPVRAGEVLIAEAAERTRYGRSGIYDVTVSSAGRPVAEFRGRSRTLPAP